MVRTTDVYQYCKKSYMHINLKLFQANIQKFLVSSVCVLRVLPIVSCRIDQQQQHTYITLLLIPNDIL